MDLDTYCEQLSNGVSCNHLLVEPTERRNLSLFLARWRCDRKDEAYKLLLPAWLEAKGLLEQSKLPEFSRNLLNELENNFSM